MSFQRGQDPKAAIGIGLEAAKNKMKGELNWEIYDDDYDGPGNLKFDSYKLKQEIWPKAEGIERKAIEDLMKEFLSGKKKWRGRHMWHTWEILHELGLLFDPQYSVPNPGNYEEIVRRYPEEAKEYALKYFKPNQIYSTGVKNLDPTLMKEGIKRGATNLSIGGTEVFEIPLKIDDGELLQMLLDKSETDPGELFTVSQYQRDRYGRPSYGKWKDRDESNKALRMAAKHGKINTFKVLFNDERSDPSATNNFALKWAISGAAKTGRDEYYEIIDILLGDDRVQEKIDLLPQNAKKQMREWDLLESAQHFERGKDPKKAMKVGASSKTVHRCGNCGAFGDDAGNVYSSETSLADRAEKLASAGAKVELFTCDDCMEEMIYQQEMESQAREQEYERQKEAEAEWRAAQEAGDYDYY